MQITELTAPQLREAADIQEKIQGLQNELSQLLGGEIASPAPAATEAPAKPKNGRRKRKKLSPQAIANIRAGVAKRMAKKGRKKAAAKPEQPAEKPKRKISAAGRRAISLAAKARWAKVKAEGKTRL